MTLFYGIVFCIQGKIIKMTKWFLSLTVRVRGNYVTNSAVCCAATEARVELICHIIL